MIINKNLINCIKDKKLLSQHSISDKEKNLALIVFTPIDQPLSNLNQIKTKQMISVNLSPITKNRLCRRKIHQESKKSPTRRSTKFQFKNEKSKMKRILLTLKLLNRDNHLASDKKLPSRLNSRDNLAPSVMEAHS